jgi:hypothetical protein
MVNAGLKHSCRHGDAARADVLRRQIRPISTLAALTFLVCGKPKSQEVILVQAIHELLR